MAMIAHSGGPLPRIYWLIPAGALLFGCEAERELIAIFAGDDGTSSSQDPTTANPTDAGSRNDVTVTLADSGAIAASLSDSGSSPPPPDSDVEELDCSSLPTGPFTFETYGGFGTAEDFDFDSNGYHVSMLGGDLEGRTQDGSNGALLAAGISGSIAGTRTLPTNDVVIANSGVGGLTLIYTQTGASETIHSGGSYPNGVEVDDQNRVYVADQSTGDVAMVDAYTLERWVVAQGLCAPNGTALSPDEQTLYVGSFGCDVVYAIDRISDTEWDTPRNLVSAGPNSGFDGINVDACGNVYISEWISCDIFRISPDGSVASKIADVPTTWCPNLRWGNGHGGWDPDILYISDRDDGRIFGLDVGMKGKKHVLAP